MTAKQHFIQSGIGKERCIEWNKFEKGITISNNIVRWWCRLSYNDKKRMYIKDRLRSQLPLPLEDVDI